MEYLYMVGMSKPSLQIRFISHVANGPWGKKNHEFSWRTKELWINCMRIQFPSSHK